MKWKKRFRLREAYVLREARLMRFVCPSEPSSTERPRWGTVLISPHRQPRREAKLNPKVILVGDVGHLHLNMFDLPSSKARLCQMVGSNCVLLQVAVSSFLLILRWPNVCARGFERLPFKTGTLQTTLENRTSFSYTRHSKRNNIDHIPQLKDRTNSR